VSSWPLRIGKRLRANRRRKAFRVVRVQESLFRQKIVEVAVNEYTGECN